MRQLQSSIVYVVNRQSRTKQITMHVFLVMWVEKKYFFEIG